MSRKVTVVSIVPFPIVEHKPGIYPGFFEVLPAKNVNEPEVLHVGESVYHVEIDENRTITVKCPPEDIAQSIVEDYLTSNLEYSAEGNAMPGLFWIPEQVSKKDITLKYSRELKMAVERQKNWFIKLVKLADDDWEKSRQHKFISDMQRYAAKTLGQTRPWIITPITVDNTFRCPACQTLVSTEAVVCATCHCVLNIDKWKTMKFAEQAG